MVTYYRKSTGSSGTMEIRDFGSTVEFWIKAGSATYAYDMPWAYVVNGASSSWREFRFESGGQWQKVATFTVTYSQTIQFKLGSTGTSGLGGPTTLYAAIDRADRPDPPSYCTFSSLTSTSVVVSFTDGDNNGAAITARRIGWGVRPNHVDTWTTSDGSTLFTGLTPGTTYYFWAQTYNSEGWSDLSVRNDITTYTTPGAPTTPEVIDIDQTTLVVRFSPTTNGGSAILEYRIGYGKDPGGPTAYITSDTSTRINDLDPGTYYYFWAQARNSVGWGPLSARASAKTVAGAFVKVGNYWYEAVPYVNVNGVWKLARPWAKHAGVWKETP